MRFFLIAIVAVALGCASGPRADLLGVWQSDRDATLENLDEASVTPEGRELLSEILGELVIQYRADTYTWTLQDSTGAGEYSVVGEGSNWVDVRESWHLDGEVEDQRIWVEKNRMWIRVVGTKLRFTEYFFRVSR